jgi:hypothetical protein
MCFERADWVKALRRSEEHAEEGKRGQRRSALPNHGRKECQSAKLQRPVNIRRTMNEPRIKYFPI